MGDWLSQVLTERVSSFGASDEDALRITAGGTNGTFGPSECTDSSVLPQFFRQAPESDG